MQSCLFTLESFFETGEANKFCPKQKKRKVLDAKMYMSILCNHQVMVLLL